MPGAEPGRGGRTAVLVTTAVLVGAAVAGCATGSGGTATAAAPTPVGATARSPWLALSPTSAAPGSTNSTGSTPGAGAASSLAPLPASPAPLGATTTSAPVRLQIPAIGVDTRLENLGLLADGELASPSAWQTAGWYTRGVRPGDPGPAIVAGHVDSYQGPAVFYDLDRLRPGDVAIVTRADRSTVRFVVDSAAQYPKSRFPSAAVYGPTPTPELRLITCTGTFDRSARSYLDNLVVTAVLAS